MSGPASGRGERLAELGGALRSSVDAVLRELGHSGSTSRELTTALALDQTTTRRLTRLLAATDPLLALTRAPAPAALEAIIAQAAAAGVAESALDPLRVATRAFSAAIKAAGSKGQLTAEVRSMLPERDSAEGENPSADLEY